MAQINVTINHQNYTLSCRDGDEERLADLARTVDTKALDLSTRLGQVGEARLLLMVSLLLADEVRELRKDGAAGEQERAAVEILNNANKALEGIAVRLRET